MERDDVTPDPHHKRRSSDAIPTWAKLMAAGGAGVLTAMTWMLTLLSSGYVSQAQYKAHDDIQHASIGAIERRLSLLEANNDTARLASIEARLAGIETNLDWMKQQWPRDPREAPKPREAPTRR